MTLQEMNELKTGDIIYFQDEDMKQTVPYQCVVLGINGWVMTVAVAYPNFLTCSYKWTVSSYSMRDFHNDFKKDGNI